MSDVSGIPNMGFGGGSYFAAPGSGLANAYAAQAQTNNWMAQQQATLAAANSYSPWANTPGGFGAQTAAYAGLGAAYGRAVPSSSEAARAVANANRAAAGWAPIGTGGIGSDAARVPDAAKTPQPRVPEPQNWEGTFNNTVNGDDSNPYVLSTPSWYPSQRTAPSGSASAIANANRAAAGWAPLGTGGIGSDAARAPAATYNPYALGGSSWYPSGRDDLAKAMAAAQDRMRAGQGWTIAQQPPAASQGTLTSRINQGIYDIGNAGTAFGQQGLDIARRGTLTPQDMEIPHAYPPGVLPSWMNPNPGS